MEECREVVPEERWSPAVGYEGWYEVSDKGNLKRVRFVNTALQGKILGGYFDKDGYREACVSVNGKTHKVKIHRLVMAAFVGPCPDGKQVNHIDGDKANNLLENLEYVTPLENMCHAYDTGLLIRPIGEKHWNSKLKEKEVLEIKQLLVDGWAQTSIARKFNVSIGAIYGIATGKTWSHLKEPDDDLTNASSQSTIAGDRENERSENG